MIVPCHRVIGADGILTGFAGGLDVKRRLLELEGVDVAGCATFSPGRAALGGARLNSTIDPLWRGPNVDLGLERQNDGAAGRRTEGAI